MMAILKKPGFGQLCAVLRLLDLHNDIENNGDFFRP